MKIAKIDTAAKDNIAKLTQLRNNIMFDVLLGKYKSYKKSIKEYAEFAVKNKELLEQMPKTSVNNIPLFSKTGMRMLKIMILNIFRKKSPAEKELAEYSKRIKLEKKYF